MSSLAQSRTLPTSIGTGSSSSPLFTVRLLHGAARFAEAHGWWCFAVTSLACGWVRLHTLATRFLGHDELFTFYIAQAPTLRQLFRLTQTVDLHPPLSYLLVRASFAIFGPSAWSCRLPFLLAFLVASAVLFWFVKRLFSSLPALIAVLFLWSNPFTYEADEARPYSLLLCFTLTMLVSWYLATEHAGHRRGALLTLVVSGFALLLSHVLGALPYAAFLGAEFVRLCIRRKPDRSLWASLLIPLCSVVIYLPLIHTHSTLLFAREYHVTPLRIFSFYWESIRLVATPLAVIAMVALPWPFLHKRMPDTSRPARSAINVPLAFLLASFALIPIAIGLVFAHTRTAFFDRYGVVWLISFALVPALVVGRRRFGPLAGISIIFLLATVFFLNTAGKPWLLSELANLASPKSAQRLSYIVALFPIYPPPNAPLVPPYLAAESATAPFTAQFDTLEPELPIVAHTGLTFLELDRREPEPVTHRLYLLTDDQAAASIAHDTVFAHYELLKEVFPIRGKVEPYCAFVSAHPHFLVVGAYNHPQGWLLRKLDQERARLRVLGTCPDTSEGCQIYEVNISQPACSQP